VRESRPSPWWLRLHAFTVYVFLYAPIVVLVLFSFNTDRRNSAWRGFTTEWYGKLWHDELLLRALVNSLKIACLSTLISTLLGTMAALALSQYRFRGREGVGALAYLPMMVPEIVMGIALLTFFIQIGWQLSIWTVILAHVAFSVGYVTVTVRTRLAGLSASSRFRAFCPALCRGRCLRLRCPLMIS
jgi:spermidine/putrescine transport system permease protein